MQTRPARADRPEVDLRRLVAGFLRMAPDFAIAGRGQGPGGAPPPLTLLSESPVHDQSRGQRRQALSIDSMNVTGTADLTLPRTTPGTSFEVVDLASWREISPSR